MWRKQAMEEGGGGLGFSSHPQKDAVASRDWILGVFDLCLALGLCQLPLRSIRQVHYESKD